MVVRLRFWRWVIKYSKVWAVAYALSLALVFIAPNLRIDRDLEDLLTAVFTNYAKWWTYGIPLSFLFAAVVWFLWAWTRQQWINYRIGRRGIVRLVLPRIDAKTAAKDAVQFWNQVSDLIPKHQHVTFELSGSNLGVNFVLGADAGANRALILQAMADWPGTQSMPVEASEEDPLFVPPEQSAVQIVLCPKFANRPIETAVTDVLAAPLVEISRLPEGVKGGILILVRGNNQTKKKLGAIAAKETAEKTTGKSLEQKRSVKAADSRAQRIFLEVRVVIWASAGTAAMARSVARSLARSLKAQYESTNPLDQFSEIEKPPRRVFPLFAGTPWTDEELATLAHLEGKPGAEIAPQLETAPARPLPPSSDCRIPPEAKTVLHLARVGGAG